MLEITYSRKAKLVDGYLYVPYLTSGLRELIKDKNYFRTQNKFAAFANSDMVDSMLQNALFAITQNCNGFHLDYPPDGVTVKYRKSTTIPMVQVTIDLEHESEPEPNEQLFLVDDMNLPLGLSAKGRGINFTVTKEQLDICNQLRAAGFSRYLHSKDMRLAYRPVNDPEYRLEILPMQVAVQRLKAGDYDSEIFCSLVDSNSKG